MGLSLVAFFWSGALKASYIPVYSCHHFIAAWRSADLTPVTKKEKQITIAKVRLITSLVVEVLIAGELNLQKDL